MTETRDTSRRKDRGVLPWLAFLVLAVFGTAAVISGAIRGGKDEGASAGQASPSAPADPSPAPPPLPRPGGAPTGALQIAQA